QELKGEDILFLNPFISFDNKSSLRRELNQSLKDLDISPWEIRKAVNEGFKEMGNYTKDIRQKGEETLKYLEENNIKGMVLVGSAYHIDAAINHRIPELINSLDMAVLTEDSIEHLGGLERPLRVLDQWTYHSRLYRAAEYVSRNKNLELIQLNSFGCGLDAVTSDQVQEILQKRHKIYTQLKIDEVSNLGAARIRVRSLQAALKEKDSKDIELEEGELYGERVVFTKEHKENHTILIPQMAPIQFELLEKVLNTAGYNIVVLNDIQDNAVDEGLKYVNNDAC